MKRIEELAINTLRFLSVDAINKANSGHPGLPLGAAHIVYSIYYNHLRFDPKSPEWLGRDRFVLSAGHGSALLYSILHLTGYEVSLDDLKNFRQWSSITPGHPEYGMTKGVEVTTGPLGQGVANAVGIALGAKMAAARFNTKEIKLFDNRVYVLCGDGDLMEGVSAEASSLAGHLGLDNLIMIYDDNKITIEGKTDLAFSENVGERYRAYGWEVFELHDGYNLEKLNELIEKAKEVKGKPALIIVKTTIGYGSPHKAGTAGVHGTPLGSEEAKLTKENLGWPAPDKEFYVPQEVKEHFANLLGGRLRKEKESWSEKWNKYKVEEKEKFALLEKFIKKEITEGEIPAPSKDKMATREAGGEILNFFAKNNPFIIGGSADLAPSTKTLLKGEESVQKGNFKGRNLHFGIREHAMGAIMNGIHLFGLFKVYGSTFFAFSDYARPAMRLSALMELPVIYVYTHDSIGVGEDGPTHQPVEHLMALRSIPNLIDFRPADWNETYWGWKLALESKNEPYALVLTRQKLDNLKETGEGAQKGAYIVSREEGDLELIIIATGSEVGLALGIKEELKKEGKTGIRVVSMPSWKLFEKQSAEYKEEIIPSSCEKRMAIELGISLGWERYVGNKGKVLSVDKYGASAPDKVLLEKYGFTVENGVKIAKKILG